MEVVTNLTQPMLVNAIKANLYALFRSFERSSHVEFLASAKLARWRTKIPHPWFNGILALQPPAGDEGQLIDEMLSYFKSGGVTSLTWWVAPALSTEEWRSPLLAQGFQYDANTPGMAMDLTQLPSTARGPASLVIEQVKDLVELHKWTQTFVAGYEIAPAAGTPFYDLLADLGTDLPFRHYLGYLDGEPVATATLWLAAGVAGIYNIATIPPARGQGIGAALTVAPLRDASAAGYRVGVLQSSGMGFRLYQQLGFRQFCRMEHFYRATGQ